MLLTKQDRIGYDYIIDLIPNGAAVLDLGCGDGLLLERLQKEKSVEGSGVEISESGVTMCIERGLFCLQGDIDDGMSDLGIFQHDCIFCLAALCQRLSHFPMSGMNLQTFM
jgi:methionine biosynthesis protein MetW